MPLSVTARRRAASIALLVDELDGVGPAIMTLTRFDLGMSPLCESFLTAAQLGEAETCYRLHIASAIMLARAIARVREPYPDDRRRSSGSVVGTLTNPPTGQVTSSSAA